jgi:hypothetical protein
MMELLMQWIEVIAWIANFAGHTKGEFLVQELFYTFQIL